MIEPENSSINYYSCFNDFFIRKLNPIYRKISAENIISPVDGTISQMHNISENNFLQAKNHTYSLQELLVSATTEFNQAMSTTFYLAPKDYHRIHIPIDATVRNMIYVPGKLFSVQPATTKFLPKLFVQNRRVIIFFDTPVGSMAMILIGAVIVGSISTVWHGELYNYKKIMHFDYTHLMQKIILNKGDELGYFKLGSTVILLFAEKQNLQWLSNIKINTHIKYGQALVSII